MAHTINEAEKRAIISQLSRMGIDGSRPIEDFAEFGMPNWKCIPLPDGVGMGKDSFASLAKVASASADNELFIADIYSPQATTSFMTCAVDYYDLKNALSSSETFTTFDVIVVGRSGNWIAFLRGLEGGVLAADEGLLAMGEPCTLGFQKFLSG